MIVFSAMRDFADGLTRGLSIFLTERHNVAERALSPSGSKPGSRGAPRTR